jgi:leucine-zipper of insertion element IS481
LEGVLRHGRAAPVVARLLEGEKMAPVCAEFGISRKTGYKFFTRYKDCGVHAFTDRSRRAYRQANRLPAPLEAVIASADFLGLSVTRIDSTSHGVLRKPLENVASRPNVPAVITSRGMFQVGKTYRRRQEIHDVYGGQRQGGISTPTGIPAVLIHGRCRSCLRIPRCFQPDGTFWYTGEGQTGDMQFVRGNLAVRDHAVSGRTLHVFEYVAGGSVRYVGEAR